MFKYNSAVIFTDDVRSSFEFYHGVLGLELLMDNGEHAAFKCGLSIWNRCMAHGLIFGGLKDSSAGGFELCFESDDIAEDYASLCGRGCRVINELAEQPWGQLVFRIADVDGNIIEFGEKLSMSIKRMREEGMTDEEISMKAHIPVEQLDSI